MRCGKSCECLIPQFLIFPYSFLLYVESFEQNYVDFNGKTTKDEQHLYCYSSCDYFTHKNFCLRRQNLACQFLQL